jgi:pimeloyl-ACP methyl ester carboxylesterase
VRELAWSALNQAACRLSTNLVSTVKKRWIALGSITLLLGVGPFLVPVNTTGTLTNDALSQNLVDTGGYRTHVQVTASEAEPYFVLLHGFGASSFSWRDIETPLSGFGTVITYDRPAFGLTDRPTEWEGTNPYSSAGALEQLGRVLDEFVPQGSRVYLVGHSAGGTVAAQFALENPDRVDGLILVAPAILTTGGSPSSLNWIYSVPQIDHIGPLLVASIATSGLELLDRSYADPSQITDEVLAGYRQPLSIIGWERAFWEFNRAPRAFGVADRLSELTLPVAVITGDDDRVVATADSVRLAMLLPNAVLKIVAPTGHLPHEESPSEFMQQLTQALPHLG